MNNNKYVFPVILTIVIIAIIIYLISTVEQPFVECNKTYVFDDDFRIKENVVVRFNGNKIKNMEVLKVITVPDKYANEEYLNGLKFALEDTLDYLDNVKYEVGDNKVVVRIDASNKETVMLKNIEFVDNGSKQLKINTNTKSSDVITISVGDNYTEGEFMKRLKNNGYICK